MSASLVGSEMCIRDSPLRTTWGRYGGRWRLLEADAEVARLIKQRARCSVSYTHLTLPTICSV
eukprot:8265310-Alexandrium_andersonii.AAC.1